MRVKTKQLQSKRKRTRERELKRYDADQKRRAKWQRAANLAFWTSLR